MIFEQEMPLLNGYEIKKQSQLIHLYDFSEFVSAKIVHFGSKHNNRMVSHWFVNAVANYVAQQADVNDENIEAILQGFFFKFVLPFGHVAPAPIELSEAQAIISKQKWLLDSATRHLKALQRDVVIDINSFNPIKYSVVCSHWNTLYNMCDLLNIPVLKYCKETYIPYKKSQEIYIDFFTPVPNDPHDSGTAPMLAVDYFYPVIERLQNTK